MAVEDTEDRGSFLIFKFLIPKQTDSELLQFQIIWMKICGTATKNCRLFLQCKNGNGTIHVVGINKFSKIPSLIATYLRLPPFGRLHMSKLRKIIFTGRFRI
ncbi:hypothetical protein BDFB_010629 [Asbolus verrucosus]|uniref:Uncharacterized protein n=1 Tax=Asbolus verrucosus TaxID=1661398 RepID=A0A482VU48_ASBVE|nr:hypothetical protein BDFB_010629 [Asbolus verrucosus]